MKTIILAIGLSLTVSAPLRSQTENTIAGGIPPEAVHAQPLPTRKNDSRQANPAISNAVSGVSRSISHAIRAAEGGGRADYGLQKVFFPVDTKGSQLLTITTPDGRALACRATFLALHDLATDQSLLIAQVTNTLGVIIGSGYVVYSNAFDSIRADIRYHYTKYSLEQDIVLHERPGIPRDFTPASTRLEIWTEWFDSEPISKSPQSVNLREADTSGVLSPSLISDEALDFGTMKIISGHAFSSTAQTELTPVGKSWVRVEDRDWLIETVDYLAVKSKLDLLPASGRSASLSRPKSKREEMIRSLARNTSPKNVSRMLMANATRSPAPEFVMDFVIVSSVPVPPNAVSWWPAGGNANDARTNNHGTLYNGGTYAAGKVGQAFKLDGNNDHVRIPNQPHLRFTNALTFEGWVYVTNTIYYREILSKWDAVGGYNQKSFDCALYPGGKFYILVSPGGSDSGATFVLTTNVVPLNTWTHVAGTYDGSALRVYFNGVQETNGAYSSGIYPGTNSLGIGAATGGASPGAMLTPFPGMIDEPTLYARALGDSEIQAIYNAGAAGKHNPNCTTPDADIVAWWPGDGNGFDLARTNFGTLSGVVNSSAVVGHGFSFDGTDDGVTVGHNSDLNFDAAQDFTLEAWIQAFENETVMSIMGKRHTPDDTSAVGYELFLINGSLGLQMADANGTIWNFIDWSTDLREDGWHHVAVTVERELENGGWLYVDGEPVMQFDPTIVIGDMSNTDPFRIGMHPLTGFDGFFKGIIDEATVYRAALDSSQISAIFAAGGAGKCKIDSDSDGLTDLQESFLGTGASDNDSDNDGLIDGDEVFTHHTNANVADTDGDGINDGVEVIQGRNALVSGTVADTSGAIKLSVFTPLK